MKFTLNNNNNINDSHALNVKFTYINSNSHIYSGILAKFQNTRRFRSMFVC